MRRGEATKKEVTIFRPREHPNLEIIELVAGTGKLAMWSIWLTVSMAWKQTGNSMALPMNHNHEYLPPASRMQVRTGTATPTYSPSSQTVSSCSASTLEHLEVSLRERQQAIKLAGPRHETLETSRMMGRQAVRVTRRPVAATLQRTPVLYKAAKRCQPTIVKHKAISETAAYKSLKSSWSAWSNPNSASAHSAVTFVSTREIP